MLAVFDIVDLLQLQEIWVRQPITRAYSRLERRQTALDCPIQFDLKALMPRLGILRNSSTWRLNKLETSKDPAQMPMCALVDGYLEVLFPDRVAAQARQELFLSVYNHFVVSQYRGDHVQTCRLLKAMADVRAVEAGRCLSEENLPVEGSSYWIPVDLTDEIRSLDTRYQGAKPDTPAAFVVSDDFWLLLVKATEDEIETAAQQDCFDPACVRQNRVQLQQLVRLAQDWNRSSSVVGLYYQVD